MSDTQTTTTKKTKTALNPKQEHFCQLFASDQEFFGNGVQSYIKAYSPDQSKKNWYKSACVSASQLLSNIKVFTRINELLEESGFNEVAVDKQLAYLINQHDDKTAKLGAIREFNKLKARITEKTDITSGGEPIAILGGASHALQSDNGDKEAPQTS